MRARTQVLIATAVMALGTVVYAQVAELFCMGNFGLPSVCLTPSSPSTILLTKENDTKFPAWGATAIDAIALGKDYDPNKYLLGGWFRAYADNNDPRSKIVWGLVTEVVSSSVTPEANLVGAELAVVNMNPAAGNPVKVGVNVVYKNRLDIERDGTVFAGMGKNEYNVNAYGLWATAQKRSKAGEYSGFQSIIRVDGSALDRTAKQPYSAVVDYSDVDGDNGGEDPYAMVWKCDVVKCGMRFNRALGRMEFIRDVEGAKEVRGAIDMAARVDPYTNKK